MRLDNGNNFRKICYFRLLDFLKNETAGDINAVENITDVMKNARSYFRHSSLTGNFQKLSGRFQFSLSLSGALFLQAGANARFEQSRVERIAQVILRAHLDATHHRVQLV